MIKTAADPAGTRGLGTFNNCGSGRTPWGKYLTCGENFNSYFSASDPIEQLNPVFKRYGVKHTDRGFRWAATDERFDISKNPNEPNRHGYIVEIDPLDPSSTPKKLTALSRFKHENAEVVLADDGRIVVYMGNDERGEFLYKYVSDDRYSAGGETEKLLVSGTLYTAQFDDHGKGKWVELSPAATGMADRAETCIHTRLAASAVKATTMDRPDWVTANPRSPEAYCCLTYNKDRGRRKNKGGDAMPVGGPNPREANNHGQIVRWRPENGDHGALNFTWDLFVVAGNPVVHTDARAGSANITPYNMFNAPDGLAFDSTGMLWIQTDGKYTDEGDFAGHGHNQMLVGEPAAGEIKRFMVGPKQCEVTGIAWSFDHRTLFVGIQHPGGKGDGHFPGGGNTVPRSSVIAITKDDGGTFG
ncbi:MAG: PhoX family phosphatase [Pseudomonadota bacterium]|nr:PhoX family phosphatase [Pseudomonadota bacterium]